MNHNLPPQDKDIVHMKEMAALGLIFACIGAVIAAMNHLLGWTVGGLILVGFNLALLTMSDGE